MSKQVKLAVGSAYVVEFIGENFKPPFQGNIFTLLVLEEENEGAPTDDATVYKTAIDGYVFAQTGENIAYLCRRDLKTSALRVIRKTIWRGHVKHD
jgi:hypothetical protein